MRLIKNNKAIKRRIESRQASAEVVRRNIKRKIVGEIVQDRVQQERLNNKMVLQQAEGNWRNTFELKHKDES